ncbi:MAG: DUF805 domain-containing protein [Aquiluna sp.]|nr:DUF805 domain-containing protein [Aquiluna sp.]
MELWTATKLAFKNFVTFTGRTSRADYWYFILALVLANTVLSILSEDLSTIFSVITLLPWLSASVRRLRDAGLSAHQFWWLLVPVAGLIILVVQLAKPADPNLD